METTLNTEQLSRENLGTVVVHGLRYSERRDLLDASQGDDTAFMLGLLAISVRNEAGEPVATGEQWDCFAGMHMSEALDAFELACKLNGFRIASVEGDDEEGTDAGN